MLGFGFVVLPAMLGFGFAVLPVMDHGGKLGGSTFHPMAHGALQHLHTIALASGACQDHM